MTQLNPRHKAFADEYLANGMNATQAYMKVYKTKSEEVARKNASRLMTNADIKEYLESKRNKVSNKLEITAERQLAELNKILELAMQNIHGKHSDQFDLGNAIRALEAQNKMLGLNAPDRQELSGLNGGPIQTEVKTTWEVIDFSNEIPNQ